MRFLVLCLLALTVSCQESASNSKPDSRRDPVCGGCSLNSPDWTITSSSVNFPSEYSLSIDGKFFADTCSSKLMKKEVRDNKVHIKFKFPSVPTRSFSVLILDRGEGCDNNAIFHTEDDVMYAVLTMTIDNKEYKSVSVTLAN